MKTDDEIKEEITNILEDIELNYWDAKIPTVTVSLAILDYIKENFRQIQ
jgi:hypothetical protein